MQMAPAKTIFIFYRYPSIVWSTCDSFSNSQPLSVVYPEWTPAQEFFLPQFTVTPSRLHARA